MVKGQGKLHMYNYIEVHACGNYAIISCGYIPMFCLCCLSSTG
jgi:hypothetical protein